MGKDKLYHLIAGFAIALLIGLFSPIVGIITTIAIGGTKEVVWDLLLKKGKFEVLDFFMTVVGAVVGTVIALLIVNYIL